MPEKNLKKAAGTMQNEAKMVYYIDSVCNNEGFQTER